jgi:glycosyltransferase involved in cell wall biosynthesis
MSSPEIIINGQFLPQRVTGVQRCAREIISQLDRQNVTYNWVHPPHQLKSGVLRQLWMQMVMPLNIPDDSILWSPTNIGPVYCKNQVLTLHDLSDQIHPEWFEKKYVAWRRFILPKLLRHIQKIITVSEFSKETILTRFPAAKGKVEVIYNGVRADHFYPRSDEEIEHLRGQFSLKKPFILIVGSLDPRKNIHGLIKAWHKLPAFYQDEMELVITGGTNKRLAFKLGKNKYKNIRFTGYVNDEQLPVLYSAAKLFVYPSLFEGFGLPVLEAMACGTPVITSNNTSLKEVAGPAVTVNPYSINEISDAILSLVKSTACEEKMSHTGIEWASRFTWEKAAQETLKILKQAI